MIKLDAGHEILKRSKDMNELQFIEKIGRVCYKSEDKITEDGESAKQFVKKLLDRGHEAMIEHWSYAFECSYNVYEDIAQFIESISLKGKNMYLRRTFNRESCRYIVSGNVRAWRDFIECVAFCNLDVERDEPLPENCVTTVPIYIYEQFMSQATDERKLLFEDIFDKVCPSNDFEHTFKLIDVSEMNYEERLVHEDVTVKLICDRGVSHEVVRHRPASFAQESTRYCNYSADKFGNSCAFIDILKGMSYDSVMREKTCNAIVDVLNEWELAMKDAEKHYFNLLELGAPPQIARGVLPNSTKTEIVVTANFMEWIHFFSLRLPGTAHPQMREITHPLFEDFKYTFPDMYANVLCNII